MNINRSFEIDDKLFNEFVQFCEINGKEDINSEFIKMFMVGFNIAKYGISPFKKKPVPMEDMTPPKEEKIEVVKTEVNKPAKKREPKVKIIKN